MIQVQDGREVSVRAVLLGGIVIQMGAISPDPVVADGSQHSGGFLYGGYGHVDIGIGLESISSWAVSFLTFST